MNTYSSDNLIAEVRRHLKISKQKFFHSFWDYHFCCEKFFMNKSCLFYCSFKIITVSYIHEKVKHFPNKKITHKVKNGILFPLDGRFWCFLLFLPIYIRNDIPPGFR